MKFIIQLGQGLLVYRENPSFNDLTTIHMCDMCPN